MSDQLLSAVIGAGCVFAIQGFVAIGAWVAIQMKVRGLEVRADITEKRMDAYSKCMNNLVGELHDLNVQLAKNNIGDRKWPGQKSST